MKYIFLLFFYLTCNVVGNFGMPDSISGVRITTSLPVPGNAGNFTVKNSYDVYLSDKLCLYRISFNYDSTVNGKNVLHEKRYQYFVFSKDSVWGTSFNAVDRQKGIQIERLYVDSVKSKYHRTVELLGADHRTEPDSNYSTSKGEFVNVYEFRKTKEYPEDFTFLYNYSRDFNGVFETFNRRLDTVKGMKLYKVVIVGHGAYYEAQKFHMPPRQYIYKMERVSSNDINIAAKYFGKYKSHMENIR